jgi:hypothetical protein
MIESTDAAGEQTSLAAPDPAIAAVLRELVAEGTLTEPQAVRVAARLVPTRASTPSPAAAVPGASRGGRLAEIAGYAGGALLLGAGALFLTSGWNDLSETARVVVLVGMTALLIVAGGLVAVTPGHGVRELGRQHDSARRRLVSVLWTFAAGSAAGAAGLSAADWELVAASTTGLLVAAASYMLVPSAVGQLGMWVASIGLTTGMIAEIGDEPGTTPYALALVLLGIAWAALGTSGLVRDREVAVATGSALALFGAQLPVFGGDQQGLACALTTAVAVACYAGYLSTRSWSVLAAGVLATALVVPEALHDWTDGSVSAAGSLLVAGFTLLAASAAGLRLRREVG